MSQPWKLRNTKQRTASDQNYETEWLVAAMKRWTRMRTAEEARQKEGGRKRKKETEKKRERKNVAPGIKRDGTMEKGFVTVES